MALTLSSIVIAAQVVSLAVKPIAYNGATGERREPGRNAPDATSVLDCIPAKPAERELPGRPRHRPGTIQRARPRRMAGPWDALTVEPAGAVQVARHGRRGRSRRKRRCHDGVRGGVVLGVGPSEHDLLAVAGGPQRIPALLQTPAYARALAEIDPGLADIGARDRAAGATLAREKAVLGERRPEFRVVIGEAALRQEVGGPAVMRAQLEMLARISGGSAVGAVQILPFTGGAHPAAAIGSLAILQFSAAPRLGVAYLGGADGGVLLEGQTDLAAYDRMFEQLRAFTLSPAQSALLLRELTAS